MCGQSKSVLDADVTRSLEDTTMTDALLGALDIGNSSIDYADNARRLLREVLETEVRLRQTNLRV